MTDYERIAKVIAYIQDHRHKQPSLQELAGQVSLSLFHFQKLFVRWAGVSPKKFLQLLTVEEARKHLQQGRNVLETSLDTGLSGPGRLHDLTVSLEGATPGEIKTGGKDWDIFLGFADSPLGHCLIAESPRGICRLGFMDRCDQQEAEEWLKHDWPHATLRWNHRMAQKMAALIFSANQSSLASHEANPLRCLVRGTQFQVLVWRALLNVPAGCLATYSHIARAIGMPKASRAVGTAVGKNPIGYLIPCHRIIRQTGVVGEYRWGQVRKYAATARELSNSVFARPGTPYSA